MPSNMWDGVLSTVEIPDVTALEEGGQSIGQQRVTGDGRSGVQENSAVQADVDNSDNKYASDDDSLPSTSELLSSAKHDSTSTYTDLSPEQTPTQPYERAQGEGSQHDPGAGSRIPASVSNLEVADSDDGRDDVEVEGGGRSPLPFGHSIPRDTLQDGKVRDSQSKAGPDRHGRHDGDPIGDTWSVGADDEKSTGVKRVGGEPRTGKKRRAEDEDGDGDLWLASQSKGLSERHGPSRRSTLQASSADESDGESDESYVAPIRRQKKRLGRRRSTPGPIFPSCSSTDEKTTLMSDVDPDFLELPIHGSLGIRIVGSKTFYALNFCQDLSQQGQLPGRRTCTETHRGATWSPRAGKSGPTPRPPGKRSKFTSEEDKSLVELKGRRGLSWEEIKPHFPTRSVGTLQVRYSTKLKARAGKRRGQGRK